MVSFRSCRCAQIAFTVAMVGATYASVPLYRMFCQARFTARPAPLLMPVAPACLVLCSVHNLWLIVGDCYGAGDWLRWHCSGGNGNQQ